MQTAPGDSQSHSQKTRGVTIEMGRRMDDLSLQFARSGLLAGAILGAVLGVTMWHSWLVAAIVLGGYGMMVGGVAGMVTGMVGRGR